MSENIPPAVPRDAPASSPAIHYGSRGCAECGADEPNMGLTTIAANVTCPTCRGWLPIVAPELQRPVLAAAPASSVVSPPDKLIEQLRRALEFAYSGSAEHGAFLRNGGGEYVPSPFMLLNQLRAALARAEPPKEK